MEWVTRSNMFERVRWLAQNARPGDSLVFHYSGELDVTNKSTLCLTRKSPECLSVFTKDYWVRPQMAGTGRKLW